MKTANDILEEYPYESINEILESLIPEEKSCEFTVKELLVLHNGICSK